MQESESGRSTSKIYSQVMKQGTLSAAVIDRRNLLLMASAASVLAAGAGGRLALAAGRQRIRLEDFGGSTRTGHDNGMAFRRAFAAAANQGADVSLGPGTYDVAADGLLRNGAIRRPSGVALVGAGSDRTIVRVTGRSVINQLFDASSASGVATSDIAFLGNGVADRSAPYAGAFMLAKLPASARGSMGNIELARCRFENFASAAWLLVENHSARYAISGVRSSGCRWISRPGNAPVPGEITVPAHFLYINGYAGPVRDVQIDDTSMEASYIKGGVALVGDVQGGAVRVDTLANAGSRLPGIAAGRDGPGSYAIMLYGKPNGVPRNLDVSIGRLIAPFSAGIYSASARSNTYRIDYASGQRDTRDATLNKGIVAIQSGRDLTIRLGQVEDSNRVVMISIDGGQNLGSAAADANIDVSVSSIASRRGARDFVIDAGGSPVAGGVRISGRRNGPADAGVYLRSGPRTILRDIDVQGLAGSGAREELSVGPGRIDMRSVSARGR